MLGFAYILVTKMIYFAFLWAKKLQKKITRKNFFLSQFRTQVIPYSREAGVPIVNQLGILSPFWNQFFLKNNVFKTFSVEF